jgi:teichuronic acid biosynthesis glycosyltransferase TuaG
MLNHNPEVSFTDYDLIDNNNQVLIPRYVPWFSNIKEVYEMYLKFNIINGCTVIMKRSISADWVF